MAQRTAGADYQGSSCAASSVYWLTATAACGWVRFNVRFQRQLVVEASPIVWIHFDNGCNPAGGGGAGQTDSTVHACQKNRFCSFLPEDCSTCTLVSWQMRFLFVFSRCDTTEKLKSIFWNGLSLIFESLQMLRAQFCIVRILTPKLLVPKYLFTANVSSLKDHFFMC